MRRLCPLGGSDGPIQPLDLVITRNRRPGEIPDLLPGGSSRVGIGVIPFLTADPNDPNRLYVAYHDTATDAATDKDLNVYLHALKRYPNGWCANDRVMVNDDVPQHHEDHFMPDMAVDDDGRIHMIFYSDRRFIDQGDDANTPVPQFDVYYAYSDNHGESFNPNIALAKDPDDPNDQHYDETCLDYTRFLRDPEPDFDFSNRPGDYNGITVYGDEVWTCFTGTSRYELDQHPDNNPSVIWSSLVPLSP